MLSDDDLDRRRPVWRALAELYLDTELQDADLTRLANELGRSDYAPEELDRILVAEVDPVLRANLASPAGVWDGFDEAWLERSILAHLARRLRLPDRRAPHAAVREVWAALRVRLDG